MRRRRRSLRETSVVSGQAPPFLAYAFQLQWRPGRARAVLLAAHTYTRLPGRGSPVRLCGAPLSLLPNLNTGSKRCRRRAAPRRTSATRATTRPRASAARRNHLRTTRAPQPPPRSALEEIAGRGWRGARTGAPSPRHHGLTHALSTAGHELVHGAESAVHFVDHAAHDAAHALEQGARRTMSLSQTSL